MGLLFPFIVKLAGLRGVEEADLKRWEWKKPKQTQSNTQYDHLLNGLKKKKKKSIVSFPAEGKLLMYGSGWFGAVSVLHFFFTDSTLDQKRNRNYLPELVCHI